jgi:hypothetical protein
MNLLETYDQADLEAIATQLSVLEIVTYSNALGTGLKQTTEKATRAANWLWRKVSNSDLVDIEPTTKLTDQVVKRSQVYASIPKDILVKKVLQILRTRLECPTAALERLSALLIREAAAGLDIDQDLLLGQQAEEIAKRYWKTCLEDIEKQLKKQSPEEARRMERSIAERLAAMTPAERLELQKTLNLSSLSGEAVRAAFLHSGGPLAGIAVVNMAGFGAYIALSVIMHAIFTTMLGITLPFAFYTGASSVLSLLTGPLGIAIAVAAGVLGYAFGHKKLNRSQYSMIVWTCVTHCKKPLYTQTDLLPSRRQPYLLTNGTPPTGPSGPDAPDRSDRELLASASEKQSAQSSHALACSDASAKSKELERLRAKVARAESELAAARLRNSVVSSAANQMVSQIARLEVEISRTTAEAKQWASKAQAAEEAVRVSLVRLESAEQRYEAKVEGRRREIEGLWKVHFPTFTFLPRALRWVAEKNFNERLEVERALIELRDASDPVSISRGKMQGTDQHHSGFKLAAGTPARIYYSVSGARIEITHILKKSESKAFSARA